MKREETVIPYDAPDLVKRETRTLTGYWDATGRCWEDAPSGEHMARYSICTHIRCECGQLERKGWVKCGACRERADVARYAALPVAPFDGTMLFDDASDRYFDDPEAAREWAAEEGIQLDAMRLMLCTPVYARRLDIGDWLSDELPEEGDVPDELFHAAKVFNDALRAAGPLSYQPGKHAYRFTPEEIAEHAAELASADASAPAGGQP